MNIEIRGVTKRFGRTRALDQVSCSIAPGQVVAVLGPNGAGKTTLLRALAGIVAPDAGEILFDGQPLRRDRLDLRKRFLFVPEYPFLFWDRSVLQNISIALRLFETPGAGIEARVLQLLDDFDLLPLAEKTVQTLSRGQIYKTGLACLMAAGPEVWILDEPLASGMDPHGLQTFQREARQAAARGATVIYTTQILEAAERFADRVCVLHEGGLRAFDTLPALEARLGSEDALGALFRSLREETH